MGSQTTAVLTEVAMKHSWCGGEGTIAPLRSFRWDRRLHQDVCLDAQRAEHRAMRPDAEQRFVNGHLRHTALALSANDERELPGDAAERELAADRVGGARSSGARALLHLGRREVDLGETPGPQDCR